MIITVILCTYNRAHSLGTALESVLACTLPPGDDWEFIVVDNNSKDNTREIIQGFCRRHPERVRYLLETKQGLSNARNAGIAQARGEIIAFVDDDVEVSKNWLYDLTSSLRDGQWAGAGGRILPPKDFVPPPWLALSGPWNQGGVLCAQFDFGDTPGELKDEAPYGTNMAFRKETFARHGGFRTDLGRCGEGLIGNEDTEFGKRLMAAGERLRYEPAAIVYHSIAEQRLNKRYFRVWWFSFGRAQMREKGPRTKVLGIPRIYFSLPNIALRLIIPQIFKALLTRDPHERFRRECFACCWAGNMAEIWNQARKGQGTLSGTPSREAERIPDAVSK
jgi:glucosyl-dolichyl phosphate glucuronosyltransferase